MSLNVWGNSWFNDEPIVSVDEPYNVTEARTAVIQASQRVRSSIFTYFFKVFNVIVGRQYEAQRIFPWTT